MASWGNKLEKALFFLAALPLLLVALAKMLIAGAIPVLKDFFKWQTLLKQAYPQRGNAALAGVLSHLVIARIAEESGTRPLPGLDVSPLPTARHYYGNIIRDFPKLLLWGQRLPVNLATKLIKTTPENEREALRQAMADYRRAFRERHTKTPPGNQSRQALDAKLQKALTHLNGLLPPPPQLEGRPPWLLSSKTGPETKMPATENNR
jgi:hypothetical protein